MIGTASARLGLRLALLVTALGLVLMHHVVAAHQHTPPVPAHGVASPAHAVTSDPMTAARDPAGPAALLHVHPDGDGAHDHAALLHLCLAVLIAGATLLVALLLLARAWLVPARRRGGPGPVVAVVPRPPPTSSRLAALQVLRL